MADKKGMNKRQRIAMWSVAILLVVASIVARSGQADYLSYIGYIYVPVVGIGILVIYLLRDRQ